MILVNALHPNAVGCHFHACRIFQEYLKLIKIRYSRFYCQVLNKVLALCLIKICLVHNIAVLFCWYKDTSKISIIQINFQLFLHPYIRILILVLETIHTNAPKLHSLGAFNQLKIIKKIYTIKFTRLKSELNIFQV